LLQHLTAVDGFFTGKKNRASSCMRLNGGGEDLNGRKRWEGKTDSDSVRSQGRERR